MTNICSDCGTAMRPLFHSLFCPNSCDQKQKAGQWQALGRADLLYRLLSPGESYPDDATTLYMLSSNETIAREFLRKAIEVGGKDVGDISLFLFEFRVTDAEREVRDRVGAWQRDYWVLVTRSP